MNHQNDLHGRTVAIMAADGFEQSELQAPRDALQAAGATVHIISPEPGVIQGMKHMDPGTEVPVDKTITEAEVEAYDALVIPGGLYNPDTLRSTPEAVQFVNAFYASGKPIAAICHGPWVLIEAGVVKGHLMTSWPAIQSDLRNAGANWMNEEVVEDDGIITSRKPEDLPAFNRKLIERIATNGHHSRIEAR